MPTKSELQNRVDELEGMLLCNRDCQHLRERIAFLIAENDLLERELAAALNESQAMSQRIIDAGLNAE